MATPQYLLISDLSVDAYGKIITYDTRSFDAVKQKISLYLTINTGEVPFSSFGNSLISQLFYVNNDTQANSIMQSLISDINSFIQSTNVTVDDYSVAIDRVNRQLTMNLDMSNGQTITATI